MLLCSENMYSHSSYILLPLIYNPVIPIPVFASAIFRFNQLRGLIAQLLHSFQRQHRAFFVTFCHSNFFLYGTKSIFLLSEQSVKTDSNIVITIFSDKTIISNYNQKMYNSLLFVPSLSSFCNFKSFSFTKILTCSLIISIVSTFWVYAQYIASFLN